MTERSVDHFTKQLPEIVADIVELVSCESPSDDRDAVDRSAQLLDSLGTRLVGRRPERVNVDGCPHLRWRFGAGPPRLLLLGHHDTVWPLGSVDTHPVTVSNGVLHGPGCFDMKAGVVMALYAAASLADRDGLSILITGDEETGSATSRQLIEDEAASCEAVLVLEAAADGGALKTERKGQSSYEVVIVGRAAHAGLEPERGVNAGVELAHQILSFFDLGDAQAGTTVTPTVLSAGTTSNTVPAQAMISVDVRVRSRREQDRVHAAMATLRPITPGATVRAVGGPNQPPMQRDASAGLFDRAQNLATELGIGPLSAASVGGSSDANFTAGLGIPTLDGLGAVGAGAHADHEHVLVDALPARTALLAALVRDGLRRS